MNYRGIAYILISALFYASYGVWSRLMGETFGEYTQAWTRGLFLLIIIFIVNTKLHVFIPIKQKDIKWFAVIALAGGLNQAPYFYGFQHLTIGTATLLFYAALLVGGYLIGKIVFQEVFTRTKVVSLVFGLIGMFAIYQFTLNPNQLVAASLVILSGLMGSIAAVLPKKLSGDYPELQIMSGYFIVMFLGNGFLYYWSNETLPPITLSTPWFAWLAYAGALLIANLAVIEGFKTVEASIGSLIGLAEIIFGVILGVILFSETLGLGTIIGASLILCSAALPNLPLRERNQM